MYPSFKSVKLIRYLLVWKVNTSLASIPRCLASEISPVLGMIISKRLSSREAKPWVKALAPWDAFLTQLAAKNKPRTDSPPDISWPIEASVFVYPGKVTYGRDELILWELKLFGDSADHGFFLETVLPAMEEASYTSDERWNRTNKLWGRFDIQAVYVARGARWEPLVSEGSLDLRYQASPTQWAEGLTFTVPPASNSREMTWITPFDFEGIPGADPADGLSKAAKKSRESEAPTLENILHALIFRLGSLLPGKHKAAHNPWDCLSPEERVLFETAVEEAKGTSILFEDMKFPPRSWPGGRTGSQTFTPIPPSVLSLLELASILHVGKKTHFGCGTFMLT